VVKVPVGRVDAKKGAFDGFFAEFEGKFVSSYEHAGAVYTLYECTAYDFKAYRVHTANETDPKAPVYALHPSRGAYERPYHESDVAAEYPLFIKDMDYLSIENVDPEPRVQ
jgi:hypothetical protein